MAAKPRGARALVGVGTTLLVGALAWRLLAAPALVRFPTDLDKNVHFEGTVTLLADPLTARQLADPKSFPLAIDQHIRSVPGASDGRSTVVDVTVVQKAAPIMDSTQEHRYVIDRSSMANVRDSRAYAFGPSHPVDRSGGYSFALPGGVEAGTTVPMYSNPLGTGLPAAIHDNPPPVDTGGVEAREMAVSLTDAPLSDAYMDDMRTHTPLPVALSPAQLRSVLSERGLDLDGLVADLRPVVTPADAAILAEATTTPVPLRYVVTVESRSGVEPTSGLFIGLAQHEVVGVHPDAPALSRLAEMLGRYPQVPAAMEAEKTVGRVVSGPPLKVLEMQYGQPSAQVAETAAAVSQTRSLYLAVTRGVPAGLALAGLLALMAGLVLLRRRRPADDGGAGTGATGAVVAMAASGDSDSDSERHEGESPTEPDRAAPTSR
jgi:hypothetical protein